MSLTLTRATRLSMFCAFQEMPAEPHMCVASYRPERDALVLLQLRVDGQIQVRVRVSRLGLGFGFGLAG